jgi:aminopeptidase
MTDPRVESHAQVLVDYSVRVQPGDKILIEAEPAAEPLVRAVFTRVLRAGGHPELSLSLSGMQALAGIDDLFLAHANEDQLAYTPPFMAHAYETFDGRIRIHSQTNTRTLTHADPARMARRQAAIKSILSAQFSRGGAGEFNWVTTLHPTEAYAQDAELSLSEYEDFVYGACHVDDATTDPVEYWKGVQTEQETFIKAIEGHDQVHLQGPNCDLHLSILGRTFINAAGLYNMPDGEIYTGPVEDSINGWVEFTYPAIHLGQEVNGVRLHFEAGRVIEATAKKNQAFLESSLGTDSGARYVGEFAIGTNYGIQRHTGNILFDEKIGGSFHMALGSGYPETGSKNESAIHWDMICDMRTDAQITADGDVVYKNGRFVP